MVYIICIYYDYVYGYLNLFLFWGGIRSLALGSDALILPLIRILCIPFAIWIGMWLWLEAMTMAFSLDMVFFS